MENRSRKWKEDVEQALVLSLQEEMGLTTVMKYGELNQVVDYFNIINNRYVDSEYFGLAEELRLVLVKDKQAWDSYLNISAQSIKKFSERVAFNELEILQVGGLVIIVDDFNK